MLNSILVQTPTPSTVMNASLQSTVVSTVTASPSSRKCLAS